MKEYAFIKNKEEMLEVVARERAESGGMSRLEKTYIDRLLGARNPLFVDEDADAITPHLHFGFQELGLPATPEEIHAYVSEVSSKYAEHESTSLSDATNQIYLIILISMALLVAFWFLH